MADLTPEIGKLAGTGAVAGGSVGDLLGLLLSSYGAYCVVVDSNITFSVFLSNQIFFLEAGFFSRVLCVRQGRSLRA